MDPRLPGGPDPPAEPENTKMTADVHQRNKEIARSLWDGLDAPEPDRRRAAAEAIMTPDVAWHGHAPVGSLSGVTSFLDGGWEPLRAAVPDLRREPFLFFAGTSNGRVDGDIDRDGHHWVTGTGLLRGRFTNDYLTIPATGREVAVRWGEFCRHSPDDGRIDTVYFLIDLVDLIRQAGFSVLPPSRGIDGLYPPPVAGDGLLLDPADQAESAHSLDHIRRFIFDGLNDYDQQNLTSMGMADFFRPDVRWYGPGGIGACLSLLDFEDHHQRPWLVAFPDRKVGDLDALIAEGLYSGAPGWAGVTATHAGAYLDAGPTGIDVQVNGLDWWKRHGDQYVENWVFVDMIHLFDQFGINLLDRISR